MPSTIRSACEACNVPTSTFNDWIRRGETGERPFSAFSAAVTRARGRGKIKLQRDILSSDDPRVKLEYLARVYPAEFARTEPRVIVIEREQEKAASPPFVVHVTRTDESERAIAGVLKKRPPEIHDNYKSQ